MTKNDNIPAQVAFSGGLTHFDAAGQAHMVDVGQKNETRRMAVASGEISMLPATLTLIRSGTARKGDVLGAARIAAIMATKRTSELIPLCHPVSLSRVSVEFRVNASETGILCRVQAEATGRTGVEIEAMLAVQIGLLTIYDMCKAVDRDMEIGAVRLHEKQGGASGDWRRVPDKK